MKKILALILASVISLSFVACGNTADTEKENDQASANVLKVGLECDYAPFNWTQTDNSNNAVAISGNGNEGTYAGGYDIEIAKRIAEGLGKELQIVKLSWDGLIPALQSGVIDCIIAGMSPTAERKESIDFTDNYYKSDLVLVVKKDGTYANATSLDDFSGAKIVGQLGTFHADVVKQIPNVNEQTPMESFSTMIVALSSGSIDGYVSERPGAESACAANDTFTYVAFADGKGFTASDDDTAIAVGVAKNSELTEKINSVLATISTDDRNQIMLDALANQPEG